MQGTRYVGLIIVGAGGGRGYGGSGRGSVCGRAAQTSTRPHAALTTTHTPSCNPHSHTFSLMKTSYTHTQSYAVLTALYSNTASRSTTQPHTASVSLSSLSESRLWVLMGREKDFLLGRRRSFGCEEEVVWWEGRAQCRLEDLEAGQ